MNSMKERKPEIKEKNAAKKAVREAGEIILAVITAFAAYQVLAYVLQTNTPMVSVVSCSMFPNMHTGDLVLVAKADYKVGDIIVYNSPAGTIIHRVVKVNEDGTLESKGDNNFGQNPYEHNIAKEQISGKALLAIPLLGYPRMAIMPMLREDTRNIKLYCG